MKIVYITNARLPTEKAHGVQIMKMNEALSGLGHDITLIHPKRFQKEISHKKPIFIFYGVLETFQIKTLNFVDPYLIRPFLPRFIYKFVSFVTDFLWGLKSIGEALRLNPDLIMFRDNTPFSFLLASLRKITVAIEFHDMPPKIARRIFKYAIRKSTKTKCFSITSILAKDLEKELGLASNTIRILPDAVDLSIFNKKAVIKQNKDKPLITYCGSLSTAKGVDLLIESAKLLPEFNIKIIGGLDEDIYKYSEQTKSNHLDNVFFEGQISPNQVPLQLLESDILILPSSGKSKKSREYTSAMKLFEYLATGVPILASNIPSNSEILESEKNCVLFDPDDPQKLAYATKYLWENYDLRREISLNAIKLSEDYTWNNRSKIIMSEVCKFL